MKRAAGLASLVLALWTLGTAAAAPQLKYVVILSRHGVRAPTWDADRLKQYSAERWPDFGVPVGYLTPRGRTLMTLMGGYYGEWLAKDKLIERTACASARRVYIWADIDQRTLETGRAFAEGLLPKCAVAVHSANDGKGDPLFDPVGTGLAIFDLSLARQAVRERLAAQPAPIPVAHRSAFQALHAVLTGGGTAPNMPFAEPEDVRIADTTVGRAIDLTGPLGTASTLSENFMLEYENGFSGQELGWGRLNASNLFQIRELNAVYAELTRRTPYLARVRGSSLLSSIVASMEQAATGKPVTRALGTPGDAVLFISGHDTNISNVSGMLGLSWTLPGYQPEDTPPGGALVFSLWREPDGSFVVRVQYLAQTLDQMRSQTRLTLSAPPASQALTMPGCGVPVKDGTCPWPAFERAVQTALK